MSPALRPTLRPMRRPAAALVAAALTVALPACAEEADLSLGEQEAPAEGPTTTADTPTTTDTSEGPGGFTPAPIEWESCGGNECAELTVPLDYDDPDGETIPVVVERARASDDRIGAIFVNPGGPGASATQLVGAAANLLPSEVTERFDVVGVDPRGVGGSSTLDCGPSNELLYGVDASIDSPEDEAALLDISEQYVNECEAEHGELLAHVGTAEVARDMDSVRAAMGDEQLNYLGFSYGTAIGQVYADLFPERVRTMVLDGVLELGPTGLELAHDQAAGFELALDRFVADCDASTRCPAGPDSRATLDAVLAASEQPGGIPAPGADRPAGPGEATLGISYAMYSQSLWPQLGDALADAADGDGSGLVDLANGYLGIGGFEVYFAVNCLDFEWPHDPDDVLAAAKMTARESPTVGEALVNDYIRCAMWPVEPEPLDTTSAPGAPPIVIVSTTGDPATPYEAGVRVAEQLESGVLVTNEGDGHTVVLDGKDCITDIVTTYLIDEVPPEDGTTC